MNWGKAITLVLIAFAGFIIYMVIQFSQKNVDLVSEDYYQQELEYDKIYEAKKNARRIEQDVQVIKQGDYVFIEFPAFFNNKPFQADVHFYKPDNVKGDYKMSTKSQSLTVDKEKLKRGKYEVKVLINSNGADYYFQKDILIN